MNLDWRSACLFVTADPAWRRKIFLGGLVLFVPFAGWPMLLGYRRMIVERLVDGGGTLLPEWDGNAWRTMSKGLGAMAIIHIAFAPMLLWLAIRITQLDLWNQVPWFPVALLATLFPIFSTLLVPALIGWLRFAVTGGPGQLELLAVGAAYAIVTFALPACFLQVSRTGDIRSAFRIRAATRLIRRSPARYVEAWVGSGICGLLGHLCVPFSPWGVAWCYPAIVYAFNEVPLGQGDDGYMKNGRFPYFRDEHWARFDVARSRLTETYSPTRSASADAVTAVRLGPIRVPLPTFVST